MSSISFLGLGAMGSRMAPHLIEAGHDVTVWNRNAARTAPLVEAGAKAAASPAEAAGSAEFVIACLRDNEASREVWLDPSSGAMAAMKKSAVAVESSTLTVGWARELADRCRSAGIDFLDAPVLGSLTQAKTAKLIYLVGGDADVLDRAKPVLALMGATIHHAGPSGSGAAVKLMVNGLLGVQAAAMAELIGLMKRLGVNHNRAVEIVASTPVCSPAAKGHAEGMIAGRFAPFFPIELVEKDFGYIVESLDASDLPVSAATRQVFRHAIDRGLGDLNMTGVAKLYE